MFWMDGPKLRLNMELSEKEKGTYLSRGEKAALWQAERAEKAFRKTKGYEPDTFWYRLKQKFGHR